MSNIKPFKLLEGIKALSCTNHPFSSFVSFNLFLVSFPTANEIDNNATAWGAMIRVQAGADAEKITQNATVAALKTSYARLDLTREDHRLSYYWISELSKKELIRAESISFEKNYIYTGRS